MKILKPGTLPQPKVYRGTCKNCRCEIECSEHEIHLNHYAAPVDDIFARCPTQGCGTKIELKEYITRSPDPKSDLSTAFQELFEPAPSLVNPFEADPKKLNAEKIRARIKSLDAIATGNGEKTLSQLADEL